MNHPYYHKLKFFNAKDTVRASGLTTAHNKGGVEVECIDFAACNPKEWERQAARLDRLQFSSRQIEESRFFPVAFDNAGESIQWVSDGAENDDPAFYLSTALPDIVMAFSVYDENRTLVKSGYAKEFEVSDREGRTYEGALPGVRKSQTTEVGGRCRVSLPIHSVSRLSDIYVDIRQVVPFDTVNDGGDRITVLFDSNPVPCFTQTENGLRREMLTEAEIRSALEQTRTMFVASQIQRRTKAYGVQI